MTEALKRTRPLPRVRKAWGTSANVDGEVLQYPEGEMASFGDVCFRDGYRAAMDAVRGAMKGQGMELVESYSDHQRREDDAWAEYNAGRGPHPTRR